jgi:hypothetical protein
VAFCMAGLVFSPRVFPEPDVESRLV